MSLLAAIQADPDADLPRLVYADFLEESGDAARAEFIRVQVELARLPETDAAVPGLEDRAHALLVAHERQWLGFDPRAEHAPLEWEFARGFVDSVRLTRSGLADDGVLGGLGGHAVTTVALAPDGYSDTGDWPDNWLPRLLSVRKLAAEFDGLGPVARWLRGGGLRKLLGLECNLASVGELVQLVRLAGRHAPGLERLTDDRFRVESWGANQTAAFLAALPPLRLRSLSLPDACGKYATAPLFESAALSGLEALGCANVNTFDAGGLAGALRAAHPALRLRELRGRMHSTPAQLADLLALPALAGLHSLGFGATTGDWAGADYGRALAGSAYWGQARRLALESLLENDDEMLAPLGSPGGPALAELSLDSSRAGASALEMIAAAPWTRFLTHLNLTQFSGADPALGLLAAPGGLGHLRRLYVRQRYPIGGIGNYYALRVLSESEACALVRWPTLARLRVLSLHNLRVDPGAVEALVVSPPWRLSGLGLCGCDLPAEAGAVLAKSPALARLEYLNLSRCGNLSGEALLPLAESPHLSPLCEVDLTGCRPSNRVRAVFAERLGKRFAC